MKVDTETVVSSAGYFLAELIVQTIQTLFVSVILGGTNHNH